MNGLPYRDMLHASCRFSFTGKGGRRKLPALYVDCRQHRRTSCHFLLTVLENPLPRSLHEKICHIYHHTFYPRDCKHITGDRW